MQAYKICILLFLISCTNGNQIRKQSEEICKDIQIPKNAIVSEREKLLTSKGIYIPAIRYNAIVLHAKHLRDCGESKTCVIRWTEWERDCEISKSMIDRLAGISCKLEKPNCEVGE
jgi:hypothetical protein